MKIISHRGNLNGSDKSIENSPIHIQNIIDNYNLDVEIDVWYFETGQWFLGHDFPQYSIEDYFLLHNADKIWCHAKNLQALLHLKFLNVNYFWHQNDDFTLTSNGFIWTYPNMPVTINSVIVDLSENWITKNYKCYAICADYIKNFS